MTAAFQMVDVGAKPETERRAVAGGRLRMGREAFDLLRAGGLPKGDALRLAEVAGMLAAKRTPELIPLCHPIALDKVRVWFEFDESLPGVTAFCEAAARAKTGVEMEALTGATVALLAVYDLVKQVDPVLAIDSVRLLVKEGGKSGRWTPSNVEAPMGPSPDSGRAVLGRAAVITVSDRCSRGEAEDRSGPEVVEGLRAIGFETGSPFVVPDEKESIAEAVRSAAVGRELVVLTGGTGLSPRDVTPESVESLCGRPVPGIGEALRAASNHPMAGLSRSGAWQLGRALIVALPGSRGGAAEGLRVLAKLLPHAVEVAGGADHARPMA
jgi:cyclic pyranopterin monophosphate synthase